MFARISISVWTALVAINLYLGLRGMHEYQATHPAGGLEPLADPIVVILHLVIWAIVAGVLALIGIAVRRRKP